MTNDEIADEMITIADGIDSDEDTDHHLERLHKLAGILRDASREPLPRQLDGLDFAAALTFNRPMRRARWLLVGPTPDGNADMMRIAAASWWIYPVPLRKADSVHLSPWINLANGERMVITRDDYVACDWEVQP